MLNEPKDSKAYILKVPRDQFQTDETVVHISPQSNDNSTARKEYQQTDVDISSHRSISVHNGFNFQPRKNLIIS